MNLNDYKRFTNRISVLKGYLEGEKSIVAMHHFMYLMYRYEKLSHSENESVSLESMKGYERLLTYIIRHEELIQEIERMRMRNEEEKSESQD